MKQMLYTIQSTDSLNNLKVNNVRCSTI